MKPTATLAVLLEGFFTQRLMNQRQASAHTLRSYRDTFRLLLRFAQQYLNKPPSALAFDEIDAPLITSRSEEHTSELQSLTNLVCRLLLEKKNKTSYTRRGNSDRPALRTRLFL